MSRLYQLLLWLVCAVTLAGCRTAGSEDPASARAVYYWRTEYRLSAAERTFLSGHRVTHLYMHLFDVVRRGGGLQPNATIRISDSIPAGVTVIPVVFIAYDALRDTTGWSRLPSLVASRVVDVMVSNGLARPAELQIDFDWTATNQEYYFQFLTQLRQALQEQGIARLSATIRLHQLTMAPPPVDYGALMVYNTGQYADVRERCSILTPQSVQPYLRHLSHYPLPLCTALPIYHWDLLYHGDHFECILRGVDLSDTARFEQVDATHYRSQSYQAIPIGPVSMQGDGRILPGDVVHHESVSAAVLDSVRQMLQRERPTMCDRLILYHLDQQQFNQYENEELERLYLGR
ncbi:MAG: hypothetical protein K6E86_06115 [Bacteroidales bacterium]|nr:hypothetical protein [Bacteroidales bacterium]